MLEMEIMIIFAMINSLTEMNMDFSIKDKVEYMVAFISEFAKSHSLTPGQAYRYLERYKVIDFIDKHYGIAHTQRFEDVVEDITAYCRRFGGAIV